MGIVSNESACMGDLQVLLDSIMVLADDLEQISSGIKAKGSLCMQTIRKIESGGRT